MIITYNQIMKEFKTFATNHKQIQNFGNGDLWEIVEHNQLADFNYPLFWVADQPANLGDGTFTWNFNIMAMDLVNKDESNENDVKSDMCQVLLDCVSYFEQKTAISNNVDWLKVNLVRSSTLNSFTERFSDELTGWGMNIGFRLPFSYNNCDLPIE
jgi:hypothetical protein|tara:strand:- start:3601 stop:4068 length:468 start_codon:yes stop_codon:yes gene_type:complete